MRRTSLIGSSLLLLASLNAYSQEAGTDEELRSRLKALASGGAAAEEARKALDALPVAALERIHRLAALDSPDVKSAVRRLVPPASWMISEEVTIGDVRARLAELVKLLADKDSLPRGEAVNRTKQLLFRGGPMVVPDLLRILQAPVNDRILMTSRALAVLGSSELTPDLLELLKKGEPPPSYVHHVLVAVGDARAALPVLERLKKDSNETMWAFQTSSLVGGAETIEALDQLRSDEKGKPVSSHEMFNARLRLRDPKLAREILAARNETLIVRMAMPALARLGDKSLLPEMVGILENPSAPFEDRKTALYLLGLLGGREHAPLMLRHLKSGECWGAAAAALNEIEDPEAAAVLTTSVKELMTGEYAAKLILRLPWANPGELEPPVLEWLANPLFNRMSFPPVLVIAGGVVGEKIRERLIEMLMEPGRHYHDDFYLVRALRPHFDPKQMRRISRSSSPDAPHESPEARSARLALRGALGDEKSRTLFVNECYKANRPELPLRTGEYVSPLLQYPGSPEEILPAVEAALKEHPDWLAGAMFLTKYNRPEGLGLIQQAMAGDSKVDWGVAIQDFPDRLLWSLGMERLESICNDEELERAGRGVPDGALPMLRVAALGEAMQTGLPRPKGSTRRTIPPMATFDAGTESVALGFLAARTDPVVESLYRWVVRARFMETAPDFTYSMCAQALARLGMTDMLDTYRRMLRSMIPAQRKLGIRCCSQLGDRRAIHDLTPLLNDHEGVPRAPVRYDSDRVDARPLPRVCDFAADAIEILSGKKFPAPRSERLAEIKAWYEQARPSLK